MASHENRSFGQDGSSPGSTAQHRLCNRQGPRASPAPRSSINGRKAGHGRQGRRGAQGIEMGATWSGGVAADVSTAAGCDKLVKGAGPCRHPRQQRRDFRAQGLLRHPRCRLDALLRGQRDVRRAPLARPYARHVQEELGPGDVLSSSSSESALNIPKEMIHYGFTKTAQLLSSPAPGRR